MGKPFDLPPVPSFAMDVWMHEVERRLDALEAQNRELLARLEALERRVGMSKEKDNA